MQEIYIFVSRNDYIRNIYIVDYGYVYMFYISDMKQETVKKHIDDKTKKILNEVSNDLHSIFSGVEINDMMCWGTEC